MEQISQGLQDNYKRCNIHVMGITEGKKEKGTEEILLTTMTENLPKSVSDTKPHIQEV